MAPSEACKSPIFSSGRLHRGALSSDQIFILQTPGTTNCQIIGQYRNSPTDYTQLTGNGSFSFTASALNGLRLNAASVDAQTPSRHFHIHNLSEVLPWESSGLS